MGLGKKGIHPIFLSATEKRKGVEKRKFTTNLFL